MGIIELNINLESYDKRVMQLTVAFPTKTDNKTLNMLRHNTFSTKTDDKIIKNDVYSYIPQTNMKTS